MSARIAFIHTSATLVPLFQKLAAEKLGSVPAIHLSDDSLIKDVIAEGRLTPAVARRVANLVHQAEDAGASHVMVTCSSIGEAVEASAAFTGVPVLRVDQPMANEAIATGSRIGVIATLPTTLQPTASLIRRTATARGKAVEINEHLCEGAFDALMSGDTDTHDEAVRKGLKALIASSDVIVLAQASMARVVDTLSPEEKTVPILSSPGPAVDHLAKLLKDS